MRQATHTHIQQTNKQKIRICMFILAPDIGHQQEVVPDMNLIHISIDELSTCPKALMGQWRLFQYTS